jgi:hypothetical protein
VVLVLHILEHHELVGQSSRGYERPRRFFDQVGRAAPPAASDRLYSSSISSPSDSTVASTKPRVQPLRVDLLILEVLGLDAQRVGLDARRQVLGDEHRPLALLVQVPRDRDDAVVGHLFARSRAGGLAVTSMRIVPVCHPGPRDAPGPTRGLPLAPADAVVRRPMRAQAVQVADALARVPPEVILLALHLVQFFDDRKRDDDVVLFEHEERVRVVEQDVRVETKCLTLASGGDLRRHAAGTCSLGPPAPLGVHWIVRTHRSTARVLVGALLRSANCQIHARARTSEPGSLPAYNVGHSLGRAESNSHIRIDVFAGSEWGGVVAGAWFGASSGDGPTHGELAGILAPWGAVAIPTIEPTVSKQGDRAREHDLEHRRDKPSDRGTLCPTWSSLPTSACRSPSRR